MSAAYPLCENKYGLEIYEEETIDANQVEKLLKQFDTRVKELESVLKFYADCPADSGMIEGTINGGEFVPLGTRARAALKEREEK